MGYTILGYTLELTCGACPEQYDVFKDGVQVGYLRERHGYFTADYPDVGGDCVYAAQIERCGFSNEDERMRYLTIAIKAIKKRHTGSEGVAKDLKAENKRLREMLETLQNKRAKFQPSAIEDLTAEQRLELEVQAMKAFIKKHLEEK